MSDKDILFNSIWDWMVALILLTVADYNITYYGIKSHIFEEFNPIMVLAIKKFGVEGILLSKFIAVTFLAIWVKIAYLQKPKILNRIFVYVVIVTCIQGLVTMYGFVMFLNYR